MLVLQSDSGCFQYERAVNIFYGYEENGIFWDDTPAQEKMIRNCAASISKQMRELLSIPEEERIDYMIEIQQGLQELMMSLQK